MLPPQFPQCLDTCLELPCIFLCCQLLKPFCSVSCTCAIMISSATPSTVLAIGWISAGPICVTTISAVAWCHFSACFQIFLLFFFIAASYLIILVIISSSFKPSMKCSFNLLTFFLITTFIYFYFEVAHLFFSGFCCLTSLQYWNKILSHFDGIWICHWKLETALCLIWILLFLIIV